MKWVRVWINKRDKLVTSTLLLTKLVEEDPSAYRNIMRLSQTKFDEFLEMISPTIIKRNKIYLYHQMAILRSVHACYP